MKTTPTPAGDERREREQLRERLAQALATDPVLLQQRARVEKEQASRLLVAFYHELHLSPEQIAQFEARLEAASVDSLRALAGTRIVDDEMKMDPPTEQRLHEIRLRFEQEVRELLGEPALQRLRAHEQGILTHGIADQVAERVFFSDTPLSREQADELVRLVAKSNPTAQSRGLVDPAKLDWDKLLADAATKLTPVQMTALRGVRRKADYEARLEATINPPPASVSP